MKTREPPLWRRAQAAERSSKFLATKFGCLQESHVFPHSDVVTCSEQSIYLSQYESHHVIPGWDPLHFLNGGDPNSIIPSSVYFITCSPKLSRIIFLRHPDPSQYSTIYIFYIKITLLKCIREIELRYHVIRSMERFRCYLIESSQGQSGWFFLWTWWLWLLATWVP